MIEVIEQSAVDKAKDLIEKYDNGGGITFSANDYIKALRNIVLLADENKRLQDEYRKDTIYFHNKWMEAENYGAVLLKKLDGIADLVRDAAVGIKVDFVSEICKIIKVDDDK